MLIDWFTVGAQALNFVILVALLKRFLYQPVLDAIDAREAGIAKRIGDAQTAQSEAQSQRDALSEKTDRFDREREALLAQASQAADAERVRLIAAARGAADDLAAKRRDALQAAAEQLDRDLGERSRREVFAIARQALADLAAISLEERVADVFILRLRTIEGSARAELAAALQLPTAPVLIRSAFDLPAAQQEAIRAALAEGFGSGASLRFETAEHLVSGIELVAGGQKVAWSIAHYLESLERAVSESVAAQPGAMRNAPEPVPPPIARAA